MSTEYRILLGTSLFIDKNTVPSTPGIIAFLVEEGLPITNSIALEPTLPVLLLESISRLTILLLVLLFSGAEWVLSASDETHLQYLKQFFQCTVRRQRDTVKESVSDLDN
jgi:hypothetical protein